MQSAATITFTVLMLQSICAEAVPPASRVGGVLIRERSSGPWRASVAAIVKPESVPPEIDDLECRVATQGLTFLLSSKGQAVLMFRAERVVENKGDLNLFDLKPASLDGTQYHAKYIPAQVTSRRFVDLDYNKRFQPVQSGNGHVVLTDAGGLELPADALFSAFTRAKYINLLYQDYKTRTYKFDLEPSDVSPLLTWCKEQFVKPISKNAPKK